MAALTTTQVAAKLGVTAFTIKRWYNFYNNLTEEELNKLIKEGMPTLPAYATVGSMNWRFWKEEDLTKLKEFKEWVPHTKNGIFRQYNKNKENK